MNASEYLEIETNKLRITRDGFRFAADQGAFITDDSYVAIMARKAAQEILADLDRMAARARRAA